MAFCLIVGSRANVLFAFSTNLNFIDSHPSVCTDCFFVNPVFSRTFRKCVTTMSSDGAPRKHFDNFSNRMRVLEDPGYQVGLGRIQRAESRLIGDEHGSGRPSTAKK